LERFIKGDVVVIPFPFSDLSNAKRRPALVVANLKGNDLILCQITSQKVKDEYSIPLTDKDFTEGSLRKPSNVRPNRIFTADKSIILYKAGRINTQKLNEVIQKIIEILQS
jgi:mRNA interferase MazF